jgi:hypothetical protein
VDYPQGFGPPRIPQSTRGGPHTGLGRPWDTLTVKEKPDATLASIEETQTALRASIEAAKQLAEKSDFLLRKHKRKLEQDAAELDAHLRKGPE